jgi:Tol biopolymer transport system component
MRYLLRLILIISGAVCLLFPVARLLGAQRTEGQIVYKRQFGVVERQHELYLLDVKTYIVLPITNTFEFHELTAAWLSTSEDIVYTAFNRNIDTLYFQKINLPSGRTTTLSTIQTTLCCPSLSPSGNQLMYLRDGPEVAILDLRSQEEHTVTAGYPIAWSPIETEILFFREHDAIWSIDLLTQQEILVAYGNGPSWSPDGSKISYLRVVDGGTAIYIASRDGQSNERIALLESTFNCQPALWSPNGRQIALACDTGANYNIFVLEIECMSTQDNTACSRQLTFSDLTDSNPSWSPGSAWIVYQQFVSLYSVNVSTGESRRLTYDTMYNYSPSWSILQPP